MLSDLLLYHRIHIDDYWQQFDKAINRRNTVEQKTSYLEYQLAVENNRLANYFEALIPAADLYHQLMIDEQKVLIDRLNDEYQSLLPKKEGIGLPPIRLNYGNQNELVIKTLYTHLYPTFIDEQFTAFKSHFTSNSCTTPIKWKKEETAFVALFGELDYEDSNFWQILSAHFITNGHSAKREH